MTQHSRSSLFKVSRRLGLLAACIAGVVAAGACGDDEASAPRAIGPSGPVGLRITRVETVSGGAVPADTGGTLALGCDGLVQVHVELDNWLLRPPGACEGARQCGWLELRVDPSAEAQALREQSAACIVIGGDQPWCEEAAVTADVQQLAPGSHVLRVELRFSDGRVVQSEGGTLSDEMTVTFEPAPGCAPDSGPEDAADAADAGDAPDDALGDGGDAPDDAAGGDGAADAVVEATDATDDAADDSVSDVSDDAGEAVDAVAD